MKDLVAPDLAPLVRCAAFLEDLGEGEESKEGRRNRGSDQEKKREEEPFKTRQPLATGNFVTLTVEVWCWISWTVYLWSFTSVGVQQLELCSGSKMLVTLTYSTLTSRYDLEFRQSSSSHYGQSTREVFIRVAAKQVNICFGNWCYARTDTHTWTHWRVSMYVRQILARKWENPTLHFRLRCSILKHYKVHNMPRSVLETCTIGENNGSLRTLYPPWWATSVETGANTQVRINPGILIHEALTRKKRKLCIKERDQWGRKVFSLKNHRRKGGFVCRQLWWN